MKISEHFDLREFVDPETWAQYGANSVWFLDRRIVPLAEFLRSRMGRPVVVNNWHEGGPRKYSGFRPPDCETGGKLSQHKHGRALDCKAPGLPNDGAEDMRGDIRANFDLYSKYGLSTVEDAQFAPTWCHLDVRWTNLDYLFIVKPKQKD